MNRKQRKSAVSDKHTKNTEKACVTKMDIIIIEKGKLRHSTYQALVLE